MSIARKLVAAAIVAGCCASGVRAEVSAETDVFGTYLRTVLSSHSSPKLLRIWSVGRVRPTHWPLNPGGDANGDLWPYVAENSAQGRWPWVAWSRYNGSDYDLVWSRWTGRGWSSVAPVEPSADAADAFDPVIGFDREARACLVWVSRTPDGESEIRFSMFLASRWMASLRVSDPTELASDPSLATLPDGAILVTYETQQGQVSRTLRILRPWTITDDITPFGSLSVSDSRSPGGVPGP